MNLKPLLDVMAIYLILALWGGLGAYALFSFHGIIVYSMNGNKGQAWLHLAKLAFAIYMIVVMAIFINGKGA